MEAAPPRPGAGGEGGHPHVRPEVGSVMGPSLGRGEFAAQRKSSEVMVSPFFAAFTGWHTSKLGECMFNLFKPLN